MDIFVFKIEFISDEGNFHMSEGYILRNYGHTLGNGVLSPVEQ